VALIDTFAPKWHYHEVHRIAMLAPADAALRAIREVTAREIRLFRFLTWLRRLGRGSSQDILNPPPDEPILSVALRTGFVLLAESPREIVIGRAVVAPAGGIPPSNPDEFLATVSPGWAKAVMNFRIDHAALAMCVVTTETRVWATDEKTERKFALYWWTIRLGSGLIRRMWLRAIRRRAERIGS
jgi:hypothetical protein